MKITIQEVAKAAGVSKGTVSRVLNGRDGVNTETREQVHQVMKRLGYVPDPGARRLARGENHVIGLNAGLGELTGVYYSLLQEGLQFAFAKHGYITKVLETGADGLPAGAADGYILLGVHLDDPRPAKLEALGLSHVVIGHSLQDCCWVDIENIAGAKEATRHLLNLGHRRIVHLSGAQNGQASFERQQGFVDAFKDAGLSHDPRLILDGDFTTLGGYRAVRRLLEANNNTPNFGAIFAASDEMAIGAIAALQDAGLQVPWDVSVVGFDDLPLAAKHNLSTVRQPITDIGTYAARLLLEQLNGKAIRSELLPVTLVARGSSARPNTHLGQNFGSPK